MASLSRIELDNKHAAIKALDTNKGETCTCNILDEIWMNIILKLKINDMLNMNILSSSFHTLIKEYKIPNNNKSHIIKLGNTKDINERIEILIDKYNFKKYDLYGCYDITDESIKLLGNLHTLFLSGTPNITDESVKCLGKLNTLYLVGIDKVTDESVKYLGNLHTLSLSFSDNITDESVKCLGNLHTLYLCWCVNITDESIKFIGNLGNLNSLSLFGCYNLTYDSFKTLKNNGINE